MNKKDIYEFWSNQKTSRHRSEENSFYAKKASEHINVIKSLPLSINNIADVGSGFGELLEQYLLSELSVTVVQDFNIKALQAAKERCAYLKSHKCIFTDLPAEKVLSIHNCDTVIATGSINQYLNAEELHNVIANISKIEAVKQIIFFDCVDPLAYLVCLPYSSFQKKVPVKSILSSLLQLKSLVKKNIKYLSIVFKKILFKSSDAIYLGKVGMGFGYFPFEMQNLANEHGFDISFQSSIYYEYRYHCIITKRL